MLSSNESNEYYPHNTHFFRTRKEMIASTYSYIRDFQNHQSNKDSKHNFHPSPGWADPTTELFYGKWRPVSLIHLYASAMTLIISFFHILQKISQFIYKHCTPLVKKHIPHEIQDGYSLLKSIFTTHLTIFCLVAILTKFFFKKTWIQREAWLLVLCPLLNISLGLFFWEKKYSTIHVFLHLLLFWITVCSCTELELTDLE